MRIGLRYLVLAVVVSAFALLISANVPAGPARAATNIQGDVTCDGIVDIGDMLQVLRSGAGLPTTAGCLAHDGDVNCDHQIDAKDGVAILRFMADLTLSTPQGCTAINAELVDRPTSEDLIDAALGAGDIDAEQALLYKMFAGFGDSRLPQQYQGDDSKVFENDAFRDVIKQWGTLSQQTKDTLAPFLKTPREPGSWETLPTVSGTSDGVHADQVHTNGGPDFAPISSAHVVVWWDTAHAADEARAQQIADAIDDTIWDKETTLMQATPLDDCGTSCPSGGIDSKLDIYLDPQLIGSYTSWVPADKPSCKNTPATIVLRGTASLAIVAHEFMHAIQFGLPYSNCDAADWWTESTAQWVMDYVYPESSPGGPEQEEHLAAPYFLDTTNVPFDNDAGQRAYGDYLLPFFIAREYNQPQWVESTFEELASTADPLEALDDALKVHLLGGFDKVWPKFALYNWNQDPVDHYNNWDNLQDHAGASGNGYEIAAGDKHETYVDILYMTAQYEDLTFKDGVKSVVFDNTVAQEGKPHQAVWGIAKIDGEWQEPEDWSKENRKTWCRDNPGENIEELVLVFSNSDWQGKTQLHPGTQPTIKASGLPCTAWEGYLTASIRLYDDHGDDETFTTDPAQVHIRYELQPDDQQQPPIYSYDLTSSDTLIWRVTGTLSGCTVDGTMTVPPAPGQQTGDLLPVDGALTINSAENTYNAVVVGHNAAPTMNFHCPDHPVGQIPFPVLNTLITDPFGTAVKDPDTKPRLEGSYTWDYPGFHGVWTWSMHPAPSD